MVYVAWAALASSPQIHVACIKQRGGVMHAAADTDDRLVLRKVSTNIRYFLVVV